MDEKLRKIHFAKPVVAAVCIRKTLNQNYKCKRRKQELQNGLNRMSLRHLVLEIMWVRKSPTNTRRKNDTEGKN